MAAAEAKSAALRARPDGGFRLLGGLPALAPGKGSDATLSKQTLALPEQSGGAGGDGSDAREARRREKEERRRRHRDKVANTKEPWAPTPRGDLAHWLRLARAGGVRVMVEIDTPGHAAAMCKGYPDVCPRPNCPMPLNVASNTTFALLDGLFADLTGRVRGEGLFPEYLFHLGGDEVNTACWTSTPSVASASLPSGVLHRFSPTTGRCWTHAIWI